MSIKTEIVSASQFSKHDGFPDYEEIQNQRARRLRQEQEGGRQQTLTNMANGLVDRLMADYGLRQVGATVHLDNSHADWRQWVVTIRGNDIGVVNENFGDFPTPELIAKCMLLGIIK